MRGLRHARSCYGHLAGELGVQLCRSFVERGWVKSAGDDGHDYPLTQAGIAGLKELGLPEKLLDSLQSKRALYGCVAGRSDATTLPAPWRLPCWMRSLNAAGSGAMKPAAP